MLEFLFELNLGGSWVDVTSYVRNTTGSIRRGQADESSKLQPSTAKFVLDNSDDRFNPRNPMGPYYGLLIRNTPVRISAIVGGNNYPRFYGEIYAFEPRFNEDRSDCYVAIEAAGVLRRILKNKSEPRSAYRHWMNNHSGYPVVKHYWALEDGPDSVQGLPDIGESAAVFNQTPTKKAWSAGEMNAWIPNGVAIQNLHGIVFPCDMRGSTADSWEVTALINSDSDEANISFEIDCATQTWWVTVSYVTNGWQIIRPDGTVDVGSFVGGTSLLKDKGPLWFTFGIADSGTSRYVRLFVDTLNDEVSYGFKNITLPLPLAFPRSMTVHNSSNADASVTLSNLAVMENTYPFEVSNGAHLLGNPNEHAYDRFERLSTDQGVNAGEGYGLGVWGAYMGRQFVQSYEEHLEEIRASCAGVIWESRTSDELLVLGGFYSTHFIADLDYTELSGALDILEDDQQTTNRVTVKNSNSGQTVVSKSTGEMSIAEIGLFEGTVEVNNYRESQALSLGHLQLAKGTQPVPRFPTLTVTAKSLSINRYREMLFLDIAMGIQLGGMSPAGYFDNQMLRIVGIEESFSPSHHTISFNVAPAGIETDTFDIGISLGSSIDMDDCTTTSSRSTTATTIQVETPTSRWTTSSGDMPFDVLISGERLTVTGVSNVDSNTQQFTVTRSVNGVVKALPAGSRVKLFSAGCIGVFGT